MREVSAWPLVDVWSSSEHTPLILLTSRRVASAKNALDTCRHYTLTPRQLRPAYARHACQDGRRRIEVSFICVWSVQAMAAASELPCEAISMAKPPSVRDTVPYVFFRHRMWWLRSRRARCCACAPNASPALRACARAPLAACVLQIGAKVLTQQVVKQLKWDEPKLLSAPKLSAYPMQASALRSVSCFFGSWLGATSIFLGVHPKYQQILQGARGDSYACAALQRSHARDLGRCASGSTHRLILRLQWDDRHGDT